MIGRMSGLAAIALISAACVAPVGTVDEAATGRARRAPIGTCVEMFRYFDFVEDSISTFSTDRFGVPADLLATAYRLRNAGCITNTADLTDFDVLPPPLPNANGAGTGLMSVHAGVVTNMQDDARMIKFFTGQGVRARSVGSRALGRRIYLGPFADNASMNAAISLAKSAGFVAPYPARF